MWTATILSKRLEKGTFFVDILYTNNQEKFIENLDMTGGTMEVLNSRIVNRLNNLNKSDELNSALSVGEFTPIIKE